MEAIDIDTADAVRELDRSRAVLVDVREQEEWIAGHAPCALHLPLGRLVPTALAGDRLIITVCRSGRRADQASSMLRAAGLRSARLTGGMVAWREAGLPVITDAGMAGTV